MGYLDKALMEDEQIMYRTHPHWIIFTPTLFWVFLALLFWVLGGMLGMDKFALIFPMNVTLALLSLFAAAYFALTSYITYLTTEYGITNRRVLIKTGMMQRSAMDILLPRIESIKVYQSINGRMMNYGNVEISGVGGSRDIISTIPDPLRFQTRIQEQVEKMGASQRK